MERAFGSNTYTKHLCFYTLVHLSYGANTCYYPDASPSADEPCDPNALFTQCCGSASNCLSNGLCLNGANDVVGNETFGFQYARGTCTDKSWISSLCPQQCRLNQDTGQNRNAYDFRTGGVQVWQCTGQGFAAEAKYCCESQREKERCCQTQSVVFALKGAVKGASTTNTLQQTATSSTVSESISTTASIPTTLVTGQPHETNKAKSTGIGVGVGVGVGLIIFVAALVFVVRRYKLKERNRETTGPSTSELHGFASTKQPVELWTQPTEMWTQPQELPTEAPLGWEMSGSPRTPRQA